MSMVGMIGSVAGSATGAAMSSMGEQQALALIKQVMDDTGKIDIPKLQQLALAKIPASELAKVQNDPQYKAAQISADQQLNNIINSGGETLADKATLNEIRNRMAQTATANRNAITNEASARGTLDSGQSLAAKLAGAASGDQAAAMAGEDEAGKAQLRTYQAMQQRANNARENSAADLNQKNRIASAQDSINQGNTAISNLAAQWNAKLPQQDFENQLTLEKAKKDATGAYAGGIENNANQNANRMTAMGNSIGALANSAKTKDTSDSGPNGNYTNTNVPNDTTVDNSFANVNQDRFNDYPTSTDSSALSSSSTRPQDDGYEQTGVDSNGDPIYKKKKK